MWWFFSSSVIGVGTIFLGLSLQAALEHLWYALSWMVFIHHTFQSTCHGKNLTSFAKKNPNDRFCAQTMFSDNAIYITSVTTKINICVTKILTVCNILYCYTEVLKIKETMSIKGTNSMLP
jgi:uncharacterized membrane protein YkgB